MARFIRMVTTCRKSSLGQGSDFSWSEISDRNAGRVRSSQCRPDLESRRSSDPQNFF
jgi:hypothetical protein